VASATTTLVLPARLGVLDELGIRYGIGSSSPLCWPSPDELSDLTPGWRDVEGVPVFARMLPGGIVRTATGVRLPFDPDEAVRNLRSEAYVSDAKAALARRAYYRVRPLLPRKVQLAARRAYSGVQSLATFPSWPLETALHDLVDLVVALASEAAGGPLEPAATWPDDKEWTLVLTHDVETAAGVENVAALRELEERYGFRSSWNLVPERYDVDDAFVEELWAAGHEVGVHGLRHDGRDLATLRTLKKRLPAMRAAAERWHAVGFRAPATQRRYEWMPLLGFDYDSSYPDTDPYEPQAGGCCTWLPFFNEGLVELPITVPQDHTVFEILRHSDGRVWLDKVEQVRARGGMALVLTHPDYLPPGSRAFAAYEELLAAHADDDTAWRALPRDVASWWRTRAERW
jgi:peptidoglycan/xylan/chitin deacetylase (PgdA/CDA1 family)